MGIIDGLIQMVKRLLGTSNEAALAQLQPVAQKVSRLEPDMQRADDSELRQRAAKLRERARAGESLDALQAEAFALAREVADRRLGMWNALDPKRGFGEEKWGEAL